MGNLRTRVVVSWLGSAPNHANTAGSIFDSVGVGLVYDPLGAGPIFDPCGVLGNVASQGGFSAPARRAW